MHFNGALEVGNAEEKRCERRTYFSDAHLAAPSELTERHKGTYEATVHFVQKNVRTPDIYEVLVRLVQLV